MTRIVAVLIISALLMIFVAAQESKSKFRPAPAGVKNVKADEFCISFKAELSDEEFKAELDRILEQYHAKPLASDSGLNGQAIYVSQRCACLHLNIQDARRIAENEPSVKAVEQDYEVPVFVGPISPSPAPYKAPQPGKTREPQNRKPVNL